MKVVKQVTEVALDVQPEELVENRYLYYTILSSKLKTLEEQKNCQYKALRSKLYNSMNGGKYNIRTIAGMKCIDIDEPMVSRASLQLTFKRVANA